MRKIIITGLLILFSILTYYVIFNHIHIAKWTSINYNNIKEANTELNNTIDTAKKINNQEYPEAVEKLEQAISELKKTKEEYETKVAYISDDVEIGVVTVKEYKIERLWATLGNYASAENVELTLEIADTSTTGIYDLNITIVGEYIPITDFIYDIEKDDTLGFKVTNFKIVPGVTGSNQSSSGTSTTSSTTDTNNIGTVDKTESNTSTSNTTNTTTTQTTVYVSTSSLTATFKIEDVGIEFD